MTTQALVSTKPGNQLPAALQSSGGGYNLKPADFIKMMVTQLQNQDPLQPASNQELLAQMSQIGQLQSTTQLQDAISGMMLQSQIGSAGNLIGKSVAGLDDQNNNVSGVVNSIRVQQNSVYLQLDNGKQLAMGRVTAIAPGPTANPATPIAPAA